MTKKTLNILSTYVIDPLKNKRTFNKRRGSKKSKVTRFKIKETKEGAKICLED